MACCPSSSSVACWSLFAHIEDGKRKLSIRPIFSRWKRPGKAPEREKAGLLYDKESSVASGRSTAQSSYTTASQAEGVRSVSRALFRNKFSQPALRAIKSVQHMEVLHSISDVDLRRNASLARGLSHRERGSATVAVCCIDGSTVPVRVASGRNRSEVIRIEEVTPARTPGALQTSRLLALPQEIRDEIYAYVFFSTRLTMGRRVTCKPSDAACCSAISASASASAAAHPDPRRPPKRVVTRIKPARHSLALFLVCRQMTQELRSDNAWLSQVLFNFEDTATMLDVLGGVLATPELRGLVREVRVREGGLFVNQRLPMPARHKSSRSDSNSTASPQQQQQQQQQQHFRQRFLLLGGLMRLLPGLRLDRLTILPALPCRVHKSMRCHNYPSVDMYSMSVSSNPPPPSSLAAPHEMLAELLYAGSGWRELCYVHHDTNMLAADRHRPSSVEAMMVNMGFWDADRDTYDDVLDANGDDEEEETVVENLAPALESESQGTPPLPFLRQHRRHRFGSLFESYSARKEYRLPRWRHILTERDGWMPTAATSSSNSSNDGRGTGTCTGWSVSIDAVIDEGFYEADTPRSFVSVYGVRGGQATRPLETLEEVHHSRIRGEDFMVVVRRGDGSEGDEGAAAAAKNGKALWAETTNSPYPFQDGDPRALGYGSRWETLRPVLFPWDHLPATHSRRDRYRHRDEYVLRCQKRHGME